MQTSRIHGYPVLAFVRTEIQSENKDCGYIVVDNGKEFVVAWYRDGDGEWSFGDYQYVKTEPNALLRAIQGMVTKATRYL